MAAIPEWHPFTIEREGKHLTVLVARELVEDALGAERVTAENMAEWVGQNIESLTAIADRKSVESSPDDATVVINSKDVGW